MNRWKGRDRMRKTVALLVYGSGGHNEQMKRLVKEMRELLSDTHNNVVFVSLCDEDVKHPVTEQVYSVPSVTDKFSYMRLILRMPLRIIQAFSVLHTINKQHNIQYVITTGPGIGVLAGLYFKIFGKKIIHIETWSRFYSKSLTGRCMYYLADYFFVQNRELLNLYPKAIYKGRL